MTGDGSVSVGERPERYARLALEHHWNPHAVALAADHDAVARMDRVAFSRLRGLLAQFGAAEQTVTEELAPLAVALDGAGAQRFVATQLYDEARHAAFFDRYWETVVRPAETERGLAPSEPTADRWTSEPYRELFDRTADAMARLVERDGPAVRARAYCHYHLAVEGVLADTAYRWIERRYGDAGDAPSLPGLVGGIRKVRRDEGRHVAFGVTQLRNLLERDAVDATLVGRTFDELVGLVREIVDRMARGDPDARDALLQHVDSARTERREQVGVADRPD